MIYQFKIQIKNITKPPVWRRVTVPSHYSFADFHLVIQEIFGWYNEHLFSFSPSGYNSYPQIELPNDEDQDLGWGFPSGEILNAEETKLDEIFVKEKQKFTYIYDFGDDWAHSILLEKIIPEHALYPIILAGKGACPPEDCGGPWGYMAMREALADKTHPEYQSYREWLDLENDDHWDPDAFDIEETNAFVSKFFSKR